MSKSTRIYSASNPLNAVNINENSAVKNMKMRMEENLKNYVVFFF